MSENNRQEYTGAMALLIKRSIAFADWAAGEGICPVGYGDDAAADKNPDEFLWSFSKATNDEDWPTLAHRVAASYDGLLEALRHARNQIQHPDQMIDEAIAKAEGAAL